jgi:hypothetical protein
MNVTVKLLPPSGSVASRSISAITQREPLACDHCDVGLTEQELALSSSTGATQRWTPGSGRR